MSKPAHVTAKLGGRVKTSEQLIRVFIRKCKKENVLQDYKKKQYYESKSEKRRRKKSASKQRCLSKINKQNKIH